MQLLMFRGFWQDYGTWKASGETKKQDKRQEKNESQIELFLCRIFSPEGFPNPAGTSPE
jgi:hypothetical protein